jgi:hypothetical protein
MTPPLIHPAHVSTSHRTNPPAPPLEPGPSQPTGGSAEHHFVSPVAHEVRASPSSNDFLATW